ncbi:MAG: phosphoglucosamine mutase [Phycisphaerae bacterium]|nr:phosphoglucosamine mutase [Phycisphaerae bacterium]
MSLMMSVSGVRGIIGETMTPQLATDLACAYGAMLAGKTLVVGRDSRPSGPMIHQAVVAGLQASGCHVIDVGVVSTPGVALMIRHRKAAGGIVITASHNPKIWNGIKFLTDEGLAPPKPQAEQIIANYRNRAFKLVDVDHLGTTETDASTVDVHVAATLRLVDPDAIRAVATRVVLDSINGAGAREGRALLDELGCDVVHVNAEPTGQFAHPPEPTAENLTQLCDEVRAAKTAVGFAQDPDADRLAIVDERGTYIGEEYTLALAAKYYFATTPGPAAANLSTSRMIDDLAAAAGVTCTVHRSAVGEANVVETMKEHRCVFGGEGNGGIIDPRVVPVRNSLVAMAIVLQLMAKTGKKLSELVAEIPRYTMIKQKFECAHERIDRMLAAVRTRFASERVNDADGVRIDWPEGWVHIRGSNTEPIARVIAEAGDEAKARELIATVRNVADAVQ